MPKWKVLRGITYPTDPKMIERLQAGENPPMAQRGNREAAEGDIVDDIPPSSVNWLRRKKYIELVKEDDPDPPPERAAAGHRPVQAPPSTVGVHRISEGGSKMASETTTETKKETVTETPPVKPEKVTETVTTEKETAPSPAKKVTETETVEESTTPSPFHW